MTAREVSLEGGPPWGFRMHGGADVKQPLRISRVNPGSKAAHRGIREGDFISSINSQSTRELTNAEAHGLLKSAGDSLRLGLNEETSGSPKRRQYRTVHQESLQETVKKSSITTYSLQKTVETVETHPGHSNENTLSKTNENTNNKGTSKSIPPTTTVVLERPGLSSNSSSSSNPSTFVKEDPLTPTSPDNAEASQRSSYTNCTISPSTVSTLSEDGTPSCAATPHPNDYPSEAQSAPAMNDNAGNTSKSKRRRQRRKNRKANDNQCDGATSILADCGDAAEKLVEEVKHEYRVDSPDQLAKQKKKIRQNPVKSKSLDDDEMIKIQELSEASETEDKDNHAIVLEAPDSDLEDTTSKSTAKTSRESLSTLALPLEGSDAYHATLMSPEEESVLRNFLETLNLVNGPEEAAKQAHEKGAECVKVKKAEKRAALEQYFLPMCQNPRYLDVINEESSDRDSDREQPSLAHHLKRGTPELEAPEKPPAVPPRKRKPLPKKFASPIEQPAPVLVGAKLLDDPKVSEGICSTVQTAEASSSVEVVFLDSSESTSPGEFDSASNDSYALESEKTSSNEEITKREIIVNGVSSSETDTLGSSAEEIDKNETSTSDDTKETDTRIVNSDTSAQKIISVKIESAPETLAQHHSTNGMFTCKKDNLAQKSKTYEELSGKNETVTTSSTTNYSFVVKRNVPNGEGDHNQRIIENGIISQLTPPPTPENMSPKNEVDARTSLVETSNSREIIGDKKTNEVKDDCKIIVKNNDKFDDIKTTNEIYTEKFEVISNVLKDNDVSYVEFGKQQNTFDKEETSTDKSTKTNHNKIRATESKSSYSTFENHSKNAKKNESSSTESLEDAKTSSRHQDKFTDAKRPAENERATVYLNALSPPPPSRSPSVSSSSSRDSSLCTAKYNPLNSSLADVTSLSKEEEQAKDALPLLEPLSLREACLKFLITLPFGADVLQELADVSLSIESYTDSLPSAYLPKILPNLPASVNRADPINASSDVSVGMQTGKEWVGLATERDPKLLVCVSPKQKEELEKTKSVPDEAGKLLELHEKFVNRRSYQEETRKETEEKVVITKVSGGSGSVSVTSPTGNRLLGIIKEESGVSDDAAGNYLYFVEKEPREAVSTLPRTKSSDAARLRAKNLTEWLNLARGKSMSESNLNTAAADIPENNLRKELSAQDLPRRRTSLPYDLYERQMLYLQEKEREIQRQLEELEEEKRKISSEMASSSREFQVDDYRFSKRGDFAETKSGPAARPASMPAMPTELFRQHMYEEYMDKFAEREERKQHKVIKVTSAKDAGEDKERAGKEVVHPVHIEEEFLEKVKQKQQEGKLGKSRDSVGKECIAEKEREEGEPVLVMDGEKLTGTGKLPRHLQEFVSIAKEGAAGADGIWAPGQRQEPASKELLHQDRERDAKDEAIPPVWTPKSANSSPTVERKEFRPLNFQSPVLGRKARTKSESFGSESPSSAPRWKVPDYSSDTGLAPSVDKHIPTSHSSPASGFVDLNTSPRLPKAQNPTITLLQKAREGQLPRGAAYLEQEQKQFRPRNERPPVAAPGDVLYQIKHEYASESDGERRRRMAELGPRKFEGIGPVTKDGMPLILRSEIKDQNQSKWYKRMYDTIHKQRPHNDEYVTVRYKQRRAQYPYTSGYLSEPEPGAYDSDFADYRYQTLDRRRPAPQERHFDYATSSTMPRSLTTKSSSSSDVIRNAQDHYKVQPGRIENYTPGHSSISEKEAKEWWDEVMDIFDGHLEQQKRVPTQPRSFINQALKESGYESDSTLVFRRREEAAQQLNPKEQKEAYKVIQKGGDVPLHGLRKPAPERPKDPEPPIPPPKGHQPRSLGPESPRKYVENEVTIHYKTPVRQEIKEYLSEDELAHRQAEAMKKIYQEERRKKYLQVSKSLQELQDMNSRRHTDNFIPSQKSPISLNRYDDFDDLAPAVKPRPRSPEPRLVARALYNFVGQTARELTFRKGDLIYVRRQVDKNWYEGELNAMVGLFPTNYVEIVPYDGAKATPRKAHEGQARAKYNFVAQTHLELSLAKGELVVITRRVDGNWFEGKIGGRKGIFPASYVEVLIDPQEAPPQAPGASKPVAAPAAHSLLLNGSAGGKESMGSHSYAPGLPGAAQLAAASYRAKPAQVTASYGSLGRPAKNSVGQALHIETQNEPVPYRALYKYNPQNDDELELLEGDTVYVLEKCDDGWYVGSSNRTGAFGTFPGNYVEKI